MLKMLDFLEHHNPLLRHSSKSWLLDSMPMLYRVLDPILEKLLIRKTRVYRTDNNQYFYLSHYDINVKEQAFEKIKKIHQTAGNNFISVISRLEVSMEIRDLTYWFKGYLSLIHI